MDKLDFSELTDDQLLQLLRAGFEEAGRRNPAVAAAIRAAGLDEVEKVRIAAAAAESEAARLRALERERIAREATEKVRRENAANETVARAAEAVKAAAAAQEKERQRMSRIDTILQRAAALVGRRSWEITVVCLKNDQNYGGGTRILINSGEESRYSKNHLVDWNSGNGKIATVRALIGKKLELVGLCAEFAANPFGVVYGKDFSGERSVQTCPTN